ncbi:hypothetical protein [Halalkalicoccus subterraneus]|uniref:hypothetical protein n=1 Tax=Halalkalicoccus subterraneus TaxID=2675002 RepID=UPI000EFBF73D|nr:hypothetical protein [Halalkalicoccus subterraneus]
MSSELTDAAVGTPVVDATGLEIGIVSAVEDGAAMLDPEPTITDEIRSLLGFATAGADHISVTGDLVESTDEGVVRLSVANRHL